ncbi:hypothetical protein CAPTEDRAFT_221900 [Capitella teleta]|uniref:Uncharacterized protein n=1 Tax=Capitella teleta TaxID=283909 RepID=R7T3M0_CAPTE|nr:hypothetical protein CAPTEDRAFT_221900 [Capitella teleta]|eukprot:ELT87221.1 hypothetical protein CAPTEDRAFT_221900 [Capitella teleta]
MAWCWPPEIVMLMLRHETTPPDGEKPKKQQAPQTFEEFLKAENLEEWPYRLTCENLLDLEDERQLLGTKEDIEAELQQATHLDTKLMNNLEGRLEKFEQRLHKYGSLLVQFEPTETPCTSRPTSVNQAFLTELESNPMCTSQQLATSKVYADCLAQSIVMVYVEAFPDSKRMFQEEFKQEVLNVVTEWVTGVRPVQGTWKNWNIKRLESKSKMKSAGPKNEIVPIVDETTTKKTLDIDDFHRMVQRLGDPDPTVNKFLSTAKTLGIHTRESTKTGINPVAKGALPVAVVPPLSSPPDAQCETPAVKDAQSHQVGPGPEVKRVLFNIQGRSPLVSHYLQMRQLKTNHDHGIKVRRTQLGKPPPQTQTYKDIIDETKGRSNELSKEYQKICEITGQEIVKIEREQRQTRKRIEDLQKELMFCKNSQEVKRLSDNIFGKKENEMMSRPATRKRTDAISDSEFDSDISD